MANLCLVLFLIFFIFSSLGIQLFGSLGEYSDITKLIICRGGGAFHLFISWYSVDWIIRWVQWHSKIDNWQGGAFLLYVLKSIKDKRFKGTLPPNYQACYTTLVSQYSSLKSSNSSLQNVLTNIPVTDLTSMPIFVIFRLQCRLYFE